MNIIDILNSRKGKVYSETVEVRKYLSEIIDDDSIVELNAFAFSRNEFYDEEPSEVLEDEFME